MFDEEVVDTDGKRYECVVDGSGGGGGGGGGGGWGGNGISFKSIWLFWWLNGVGENAGDLTDEDKC